MLTIATVRHSRLEYYLAAWRSEPGLDHLEEPGTWLGSAAAALGLGGGVIDEAMLRSVLAARRPDTEAPLLSGPDRRLVAAYDCTFSCPKSVSLLAALGPTEIAQGAREAHAASVAAALDYLERTAAVIRRTRDGRRTDERASGLVAASVVHRASRAPDPHLHSHVLVANLGSDSSGRFSALDGRQLFAARAVAGALYESDLRRRLGRKLGVCFRSDERGVLDLVGLPGHVRREFSRRSDAIAAELADSGYSSHRASKIAARVTRPGKDHNARLADLEPVWSSRAIGLGVAPSRWRRLAPGRDVGARIDVAGVVHGFEVPFTRRELLTAVARSAVNGASIGEIESGVDALLADQGDIRLAGARHSRLGVGSGRFPAGAREPCYTTAEIEALHDALESALGSALLLESAELRGDGIYVLPAHRDETAVALQPLFGTWATHGRVVRLGGPDPVMTQAVVEASGGRVRLGGLETPGRPGSVRIVVGAELWRLRPLAAVLATGGAGRGSVVLVGDPATAGRPAPGRAALALAGLLTRMAAERDSSRGGECMMRSGHRRPAALESTLVRALARSPRRAPEADLAPDPGRSLGRESGLWR